MVRIQRMIMVQRKIMVRILRMIMVQFVVQRSSSKQQIVRQLPKQLPTFLKMVLFIHHLQFFFGAVFVTVASIDLWVDSTFQRARSVVE